MSTGSVDNPGLEETTRLGRYLQQRLFRAGDRLVVDEFFGHYCRVLGAEQLATRLGRLLR